MPNKIRRSRHSQECKTHVGENSAWHTYAKSLLGCVWRPTQSVWPWPLVIFWCSNKWVSRFIVENMSMSSLMILAGSVFNVRRYATAVYAVVVCPSVCLSVCPFVRPLQAGMVPKRLNVRVLEPLMILRRKGSPARTR